MEQKNGNRQEEAETWAKERNSLGCSEEKLTRPKKRKCKRRENLERAREENVREAGGTEGDAGGAQEGIVK